jgi:hypothetical protein
MGIKDQPRQSSLETMKEDLARLSRGDVLAGLLVAVPLFALLSAALDQPSGLALSLTLSWLAFVGAAVFRRRTLDGLQARCQANRNVAWRIRVNGVDVGTMTDLEFACVWLDVLNEPGAYLRQLLAVCMVIVRLVWQLIRALPALFAIATLALAISSPDDLARCLVGLSKATPIDVKLFVAGLGHVAIVAMSAWFCASIALNAFLDRDLVGFQNEFEAMALERVRQFLGEPATGEVTATRVDVPGAAQDADRGAAAEAR